MHEEVRHVLEKKAGKTHECEAESVDDRHNRLLPPTLVGLIYGREDRAYSDPSSSYRHRQEARNDLQAWSDWGRSRFKREGLLSRLNC